MPMPSGNGRRTIKTDFLARVEGEGAMRVVIRTAPPRTSASRIYEPPRFFEAFLRGCRSRRLLTSPPASAGSARSPTR